ncbi:hypothetical protein [Azospirillum palustre]
MLWTERGTLNHAKILGTDEAWIVHERLVDTYFAAKEGAVAVQSASHDETIRRIDGINRMLAHKVTGMEKELSELVSVVRSLVVTHDPRIVAVDAMPVEGMVISTIPLLRTGADRRYQGFLDALAGDKSTS